MKGSDLIAKIIVKSGYIKNFEHAANLIHYAGFKLEAQALHLEDGTIKTVDVRKYVEYIATRPSVEHAANQRHGLFTLDGDADMDVELQKLRDCKDSTKWSQIISLEREDAERTGFDNRKAWQNLIRAKAVDIAKLYNIDIRNLVVNAAYHDKDYHPHVHILFYSTDRRQGYVNDMKAASEKLKSLFFNEIFHEDVAYLKEQKTEQRNELDRVLESSLKRLYSKEYTPPAKLPEMLLDLSRDLEGVAGKKVYGFLPPELKQKTSAILRYCVENDSPMKALFEQYRETQRNFISQYVNEPEKIESRLQAFESAFFDPGKSDGKTLHNIIIRYAAALGVDPEPSNDGITIQKENDIAPVDLWEPTPETDTPEPPRADFYPDSPSVDSVPWTTEEEPDALDKLINRAEKGDARAQYQLAMVNLNGDGLPKDEKIAYQLMQMAADGGNAYAAASLAKMYRDGTGTEKNEVLCEKYYYLAFKAFDSLEQETGSDRIQYRLAGMYRRGEGCAVDIDKAVEYYQRAADQDNAYAQYALGKLYLKGEEVPKDVPQALTYFGAAASGGHSGAQYTLGKLYLDGNEVERNEQAAVIFLKSAAVNGNTFAQFTLGRMYEKGNGVKADKAIADEFYAGAFAGFTRLEEKEHDAAVQYRLGRMNLDGKGTPPDEAEAIAWLEKAAKGGEAYAQYTLAKLWLSKDTYADKTAEALGWLQAAADQGGDQAQYALGKLYLEGKQMPKNELKAFAYLQKSADQGNSFAQYTLGKLYLKGEDIKKNLDNALDYLKKSADNGNEFAQYTLGSLYLKGEEVPKDVQRAFEWLQKSADQGNSFAQYSLGKMYLDGTDVPTDADKALHYFTAAAMQENDQAQYKLGRMYLDRDAVSRDISTALYWLQKSADQGNSFAQCSLGKMYLDGTDIPMDADKALHYFTAAAMQENDQAQYKLGRMYLDGNAVSRDIPTALYWMQKSADQGNSFAQYSLGKIYLDGTDIPTDADKALHYFTAAAMRENDQAQYKLGRMYLDGNAVSWDIPTALYWLQKSAGQNNPYAQYRLGRMFLRGEGVRQDRQQAVVYLTASAKQGNAAAQYSLAHMNDSHRNMAAYAAAMLMREIGRTLDREAKQEEALYSRNSTAFHRAQVRQRFVYRKKQQSRHIDEISY